MSIADSPLAGTPSSAASVFGFLGLCLPVLIHMVWHRCVVACALGLILAVGLSAAADHLGPGLIWPTSDYEVIELRPSSSVNVLMLLLIPISTAIVSIAAFLGIIGMFQALFFFIFSLGSIDSYLWLGPLVIPGCLQLFYHGLLMYRYFGGSSRKYRTGFVASPRSLFVSWFAWPVFSVFLMGRIVMNAPANEKLQAALIWLLFALPWLFHFVYMLLVPRVGHRTREGMYYEEILRRKSRLAAELRARILASTPKPVSPQKKAPPKAAVPEEDDLGEIESGVLEDPLGLPELVLDESATAMSRATTATTATSSAFTASSLPGATRSSLGVRSGVARAAGCSMPSLLAAAVAATTLVF